MLTKEQQIKEDVRRVMSQGISDDYVSDILDALGEDIISDIQECADEEYSEGDIKLSIGRAILSRLILY